MIGLACFRDVSDGTKEIVQENWLVLLFRELEKQGITLPERWLSTIFCAHRHHILYCWSIGPWVESIIMIYKMIPLYAAGKKILQCFFPRASGYCNSSRSLRREVTCDRKKCRSMLQHMLSMFRVDAASKFWNYWILQSSCYIVLVILWSVSWPWIALWVCL